MSQTEVRKPIMPLIAIVLVGVVALLCIAFVLPQILPSKSSNQIVESKKFQSQEVSESVVSLNMPTFNGYVAVKPSDSRIVLINVTMRGHQDELKDINFDFKEHPGNGMKTVSLKVRSTTMLHFGVSADIDVLVPKGLVYYAILDTSNGKIEISSLKGEKLTLHTSNGAIITSLFDFGSYKLVTSNGRIEVDVVYNTPIRIQANPSNGKINFNMPLTVTQSSDNTLFGYTSNYDSSKPNIGLQLSTSNGNVDIMYLGKD